VHAIRLPPEIERRLEQLAKRTGRTKTSYAREAILNYLEELEDTYIGEKRLDEFYESGTKAIPLSDVLKRYGMDT
jgi:RHH-type transcriptional regulator, rel operon repressor / antitoxin RelB